MGIFFYIYLLRIKPFLLRIMGIKLGENCRIFTSLFNFDNLFPGLIEIGDNTVISRDTLILTHDFSVYGIGNITDSNLKIAKGKVKIGNNCFVGVRCIILPGVSIGDNVIIGAGSVVNKDIPSNTVAAGNPVKVISSREEFRSKHKLE